MTDTGSFIDLGIPATVEHPGRPPRRSTLVGLAAVAAVLAGAVGYTTLHGFLPDPETAVPVPPVPPAAAGTAPPALGKTAVPGAVARPGLVPLARRPRGPAG